MAVQNDFIITGNLGATPEITYTPTGKAVTKLSLAHTPRFRGTDGEWKDGDTTWYVVEVWNNLAVNIAASGIQKGQTLTVKGRLLPRPWKTKDGEDRVEMKIVADDVFVSFDRYTISAERAQSNNANNGGGTRVASTTAPVSDNWDNSQAVADGEEAPF